MKVAFVNRSSVDKVVGGDTIQMKSTASELKKLGCEVEMIHSADQITSEHQLVHFFNIIRPQEILPYLKLKIPKVVSSIYVDYSEFDQKSRSGLQAKIARSLGKNGTEYMKALVRHFKGQEKIRSQSYILKGHKKAIQSVLNNIDYLLPNSHSEYERLVHDFSTKVPYEMIPNGVDPKLFPYVENQERAGLLCVGRIEGGKNQLNLILALNDLKIPARIIGRSAPNHQAYKEACMNAAESHIRFEDFMPQEELAKLYGEAQTHALPSWFETTGLSSLEAAGSGCIPIVSPKGDVQEYFSEIAEFCEPESVESIKRAILRASQRIDHERVSNYVHSQFTWKIAAERSFSVYQKLV